MNARRSSLLARGSRSLRYWDLWFTMIPVFFNVAGLVLIRLTAERAFTAQLLFSCLGIGLYAVVSLAGYGTLIRFSRVLYAGFSFLLLATLFFAPSIAGSKAWLVLGPFHLQPAEWMKPILALVLAEVLIHPPVHFLKILAYSALPLGLILMQPDLGTAVTLATVAAVAFFFQRISWRLVTTIAACVILAFLLSWFLVFKTYQKQRILTFLFPSYATSHSGYQAKQSLIAVGSGRVSGKGMSLSTQSQLKFLPAQHTDFIFANLAERKGFIGVALSLALYAAFILRMLYVGNRSPEPEGKYLAYMLAGVFSFHVMYNMGMVVAVVPITGIPLPFMSYGGSFLTACYFAAGLLNSISVERFGPYEG
jgi:rod shape determining protein RodA